MGNFFTTGPFWAVYVVLFLMAMARGQMMYWIGRIPTEQALKRTAPTTGWRARAHRWLSDGGADAGVRSIQRWGLPVVSFCYVTVGFQSLVQAAAGMLRIPLLWYILAQIPGSLAWAAIYSTIGFGLWAAIIAAAAGSPAGLIAMTLALALAVTLIALRIRRKRARAAAEPPLLTGTGTEPVEPGSVDGGLDGGDTGLRGGGAHGSQTAHARKASDDAPVTPSS
ncbi:DedA family protein [Pseudactinotalea sp. Z1732]|uniref:DedA family protein n=1 Tax=Pseudactinotalea sp. Z1732 TaxID=3413026 RepID=UPI003C7ABA85